MVLLLPTFGFAQEELRKERVPAIGIGAGLVSLQSDLQENFTQAGLETRIQFILNTSSFFSVSFLGYFGSVIGQNPSLPSVQITNGDWIQPNQFVQTNYQGIALMPRVRLVELRGFHVHATLGIGVLRFQACDDAGQDLIDLPDTRNVNEVYGASSIHLPIQLQVGYLWPNQIGWQLQAGFHNPLTDYLDNIGELGGREGNDQMLAVSLMVFYHFN